jgi:hypothetical protein
MSTAQNSHPKLEGLLAASSQVTISPVSLPVSTPTSRSGVLVSLAPAVELVPGPLVSVAPALVVSDPVVGTVSPPLVTVAPLVAVVAVVTLVTLVAVVSVVSPAVAELAGSPSPHAGAATRSENTSTGRVEVIMAFM